MKNYILNAKGNGKKALFYFSLITFAIGVAVFGILVSMGVDNPLSSKIDLSSAASVIGVVLGFGLIMVSFSWIVMCILAWITSLFVTRKLEASQRKRYAAVYYIGYSIVGPIIITPFVMYADALAANALSIIFYFGFLKLIERKLIK